MLLLQERVPILVVLQIITHVLCESTVFVLSVLFNNMRSDVH